MSYRLVWTSVHCMLLDGPLCTLYYAKESTPPGYVVFSCIRVDMILDIIHATLASYLVCWYAGCVCHSSSFALSLQLSRNSLFCFVLFVFSILQPPNGTLTLPYNTQMLVYHFKLPPHCIFWGLCLCLINTLC